MARSRSAARPVRVAHVSSSDLGIPPMVPFCRPLVERGWDVTMINPDGPNVALAHREGMRWLPLGLRRTIHPATDLTGALQLARYFREHQFDIIHTHNIKASQIGRVVAAATRMPIIVHTIHGMAYSLETPSPKRQLHALLERVASSPCDTIFAQSREDIETMIETGAAPAEKLVYIGNGINLTKYDPARVHTREQARRELGVAPEDVLFVSAGRLIVEKGFVELFDAADRARRRDPRIRLAVAGALDERSDTLDAATLDRARAAGILLLGRHEDMPSLYAASDVVALASWHEGVPRVLMEGAAMGKPLLASDVRGCREVVRPPKNGLLVPWRDPGALADAMLRLAGDEALRARLGRDNASEARERYDIHKAVDIVIAGYDRLLARRA